MDRYQNLSGYQKFIIFALIILFVIFTVVYALTISQVGYGYMGTILVHSTENENDVYAGEIQGQYACFTVSSDQVVTFVYGEKTYGPYTVKDDPTAIPKGKNCTRGVEIRDGNAVFFRGGYFYAEGMRFLYSEDGSSSDMGFTITSSGGGIVTDGNGNIIDTMKPSAHTILSLAEGPKLTHRGSWIYLGFGFFLSAAIILSVLFADELFRFRLAFHVQDADMAEPTDWEVSRRGIGWGVSALLIFILYIVGLQ